MFRNLKTYILHYSAFVNEYSAPKRKNILAPKRNIMRCWNSRFGHKSCQLCKPTNIHLKIVVLIVQKSKNHPPPGIFGKTTVNHGISTTNLPQLVGSPDFWTMEKGSMLATCDITRQEVWPETGRPSLPEESGRGDLQRCFFVKSQSWRVKCNPWDPYMVYLPTWRVDYYGKCR